MRIRQKGIIFHKLEIIYYGGLGVLVIFAEVLHPIVFRGADGEVKMPFLPLLLLSVYCTCGLAYAWLLSYQQFTRKVDRIMSYAESPFLSPAEEKHVTTNMPSLVLR